MKTKEQFEKIRDAAQAGIDALEKAGPWVPEARDTYWYVNSMGFIHTETWDELDTDKAMFEMGNVYPTKEAAEQARDRQLATVKVVRRIAELNSDQGWVADWSDPDMYKYFACWEHGKGLRSTFISYHQSCYPEWYGSKETIEAVIKDLPEEIRLMLGVES